MATAKKTTKKAPITVEFEFDRDTKNTRRFAEVGNNAGGETDLIGTLYVQKAAFSGTLPESITVTIESN